MGKNKGQRSKNNSRPSSSSKSAEFLGSAAPSFIGFTASKDGGFVPLLPGLQIENDVDLTNIDPSFQLLFKKMNKKDPVTRFKALEEFTELIKNLEMSAIEAMLPFWPRFYNSLAVDVDHRVREVVQMTHAAVMKRVGKKIAPYLKQLAGAWFVSQFDVYPPVASAAINCFNTTFSPEKVTNAIIHCQNEILKYISNNIIVQNAQTLSYQKNLTNEDMEAKYQRVLTSSLQAYNFYLKTVPQIQIEKMTEHHKCIISNNRFWKLCKHEVPSTKTAFFAVLTAIMIHANFVIEDKKKILVTIMNSLDDNEPSLLAGVWESLLVAINKIDNWHQIISVEKLVLPKLWKVLRNGGKYCANVVYPNLLPFISFFPKFEIDKKHLFTNFFDNMRQGFTSRSVKLSRSEAFTVATSFGECFRYAILINSDNEETCEYLLKNQLIPVIESCILENVAMRPIFFCELTHLLRYWSKNRDNKEFPAYSKLVNIFWDEVCELFNKLIDNSIETQGAIEIVINSMSELLLYLKTAPDHSRRNMKVKFSDSAENMDFPSVSAIKISDVNENDRVIFCNELQQIVTKLCISYFKKINEKPHLFKVTNLVKIISNHESEVIFKELAKTFDESANLLDFYDKILKNLLSVDFEETEALINLIFSMMSFMNDTEKETILDSFKQTNNEKVLKTAIQFALKPKFRENLIVRNWCKHPDITNKLIQEAQDFLCSLEFSESDEKMFIHAFEVADTGDVFVSSEALSSISSTLSLTVDRMPWNNEKKASKIANLLSKLLSLTWTHKEINPGTIKLLKSLFRLNIRDNLEREEDVESAIVNIAHDAWRKGLYEISRKIPQDVFAQHVKYFASIIWEKIFQTNDNSFTKESLTNLASNFIETLIKCSDKYTKNFVAAFMVESDIKKWMKDVSGIVIYGEVVNGNMYLANLKQKGVICNEVFDIDFRNISFEDNVDKCMKWAIATTKILNKLLSQNVNLPDMVENLINLFYAVTLGNLYINNYKFAKHYNEVYLLSNCLDKEFAILKNYIPDDIHDKVLYHIQQLCSTFGGIFYHVFKFYYESFKPNFDIIQFFKIDSNESANNKINNEFYLQCAQILGTSENLEKVFPSDINSNFSKIFFTRWQFYKNYEIYKLDEIFEMISTIQKTEPLSLLLDCDVYNVLLEKFTFPLEVIYFFTQCIKQIPKRLSVHQWDIIELCLSSWNLSINKSKKFTDDIKVKTLIINVNKLYYEFQKLMNEHEKNPIDLIPPTLLDEWKNVFENDLQLSVLETWLILTNLYNEQKKLQITSIIAIDYIGKSLKLLNKNLISQNIFKENKLSLKQEEFIQLLIKLLQSSVLSLQLSAFILLNYFVDNFVEQDKNIIEVQNFDEKTINLYKFKSTLKATQTIVNTLLMDFKLCDVENCTIQPFTDAYTYTIGYVLAWSIVLNMCAKANGYLRFQYAEILKDEFFPSLLNNIFRLMPISLFQNSRTKFPKLVEFFSSPPSFEFFESWTERRLDHIVCWLYTNCLRYLPVLVRQWWSTADSRISASVDNITKIYISPFLCNEELHDNRLFDLEAMQVKTHPNTREVVALYQMDDTTLELKIILPANHPLGTVTVEPGQHAGGTANWKNCHMQLSLFLTHQNGSIWDGLKLWKTNLDKRFSGVEECYICFSIFHISTYQIPKLSCQTCKKKFHSFCLYKWFNTSHKSTCPICRNVF